MVKELRKDLKALYKNDALSDSFLFRFIKQTEKRLKECEELELDRNAAYFRSRLAILLDKVEKGNYKRGVK